MAGSTKDVRAGGAFIELFAEDGPLRKTLARSSKRLKAWGASLAAGGAGLVGGSAAMIAPLLGAAKLAGDVGGEFVDMAARTGMSVESLSALGHAAGQTGADLATVEGGVRKMQKVLGDAGDGSKEAVEALDKLGISFAEIRDLSPDQQFRLIASRLNAIEDPTVRAAVAMQVFGKSGTALLPMIDQLEELTAEAEALGLVLSKEDAEAADAFGDAVDGATAQVKAATVQIGVAVAGALLPYKDAIHGTLRAAIDWIKEHRGIVVAALAGAAAVGALGVAVVTLGIALTAAGALLGAVSAVLGVILSPLGLVTAGVIAAGAAFFTMTEQGRAALDWLGQKFGTTLGTVRQVVTGIINALKSGNYRLAAEIGLTGIKIAWEELKAFISGLMDDIGDAIVSGFINATAEVKKTLARFGGWYDKFIKNLGDLKVIFDLSRVVEKADKELAAAKQAGASQATIKDLEKKLENAQADLEYAIDHRDKEQNAASAATLAEMEKIEQQRQQALSDLAQMGGSRDNSKAAELEKRLAELTAQLKAQTDQAQGEADDAAAASDFRRALEETIRQIRTEKSAPDFDPNAISDAVEAVAPSRGFFNAFAAQGVVGAGTNELAKIASATDRTAANTAEIARKMPTGGFGTYGA